LNKEKGNSAWNVAGTWEEKKINMDKLKVYLENDLK